ncbi:MAG TPA: patatin-like phospholipase family protein [Candidatus Binatia bacterium]|nr:patatin-like phospholipase family protein [Candidatus Binatia bacterium]
MTTTLARNADSGGKLGLVLSGGGARGPFQVGVYERLLRDPRFAEGPAVLSGTSAGSLNAAMIACGMSPREMMDAWNAFADDPPVIANTRFFSTLFATVARLAIRELAAAPARLPGDIARFARRARHYWPPRIGSLTAVWLDFFLTSRFDLLSSLLDGIESPSLVDTGLLRERLIQLFGSERVPARRRLAINTVDVNTGRVVRYVTGPVPAVPASEYIVVPAISVDMLVASCSIPLLFNPVTVGARLLWDGGLLVNTPLAPAVALGADQIVTVMVTEQHRGNPPLRRFGRALERTADSFLENAYNVDRLLLLERNRLSHLEGSPYRDVKLYQALRPAPDRRLFSAGSYLNFQRPMMAAMYRAGQRAASEWLALGPPIDRLEARQSPAPSSTRTSRERA